MLSYRRVSFISWVLAALVVTGSAGCTFPLMLAVGAGAVGGYAASRDTFEGVTAKSQEELWDAASKVASIMGMVQDSDRRRGEVFARINGVSVTITIVPINLTNTKLRVKARRGIFPQIGTAQEVYSKIINQLEQ